MDDFRRYAVYVAPTGDWADWATAWLGWDAASGRDVEHPDFGGLPRPVAELTATPRRYGLHATIKPPFRPAEGLGRPEIEARFAAFCENHAAVELDGLEISPLAGFVALTPEGDPKPIRDLAAAAVEQLDGLRAEPTEEELEGRRSPRLTPAQEANLDRWGYPYVMGEFRFHITLTGRLEREESRQVTEVLKAELGPRLPHPYRIGDLGLFGEDSNGFFHLIHRKTLSG